MCHAGRVALVAVAAALALGLATLCPAPASADEGESALSVGLSFATFAIPDHDGRGAGLGMEYERGLSDAFWLRASATGAVHRDGGDDSGTTYTGLATIGLTYVVDVLKYVPYLHAGVGAVGLGGGAPGGEVHPVAEMGIGLDILARRGLSYGVFGRLASFLDDSAFVNAGVRVTWRWGFF